MPRITPLLLLLGPACLPDSTWSAGDGPAGYAATFHGCGPDDAPTIELHVGLAQDRCDAEYGAEGSLILVIEDETYLAPDTHRTLEVRYDLDGDGVLEEGITGELSFERHDDGAVLGSWEIRVEGETLTGEFSGRYCDAEVLCG